MQDKKLDLNEIRDRIDIIDDKLVKLLEERLDIVSDVAKYKKENNMKIFDRVREKEVIDKNKEKVEKKDHIHYIERILTDLMSASKEYQKFKIGERPEYTNNIEFINSKVGYTGIPGSNAHEVLINLLSNNENKVEEDNIIAFKSHEELVSAVSNQDLDFAIIPVENTITGEVRDTVDLINEKDVYIVGEVKHKIEHLLLGLENSSIQNIKKVFSHEQALLQCSKYLNSHVNIEQIHMSNTALSAKYIINNNDESYACVASKSVQKMYNLKVLAENISNIRENYTRFIIISNKMLISEDANKISIITSTSNEAGSLFKLLENFSHNNVSMTSIKSRPIINKPWEYYFYIDFEGNLKDESIQNVLQTLREKSNYLEVLGNYRNFNCKL